MYTEINKSSFAGENVTIKEGTFIGENVIIEDNVYIDYGCIIRDNVHIKKNSFIGARSILGEYLMDFYGDRDNKKHPVVIGENALVRTENVIYGDTKIGDNFQTGHKVTIRENSDIGDNVRIGTLSDVQHSCEIGNFVNIHSNVFIGEKTKIKDYVWLFPHVVITNDPTPPSNDLLGVTIESFASIAAKSVILPGVHIYEDALVGAGSVVVKDVPSATVVVGNPARNKGSVTQIKNKVTGKPVYPWRYSFDRGMPWKDIGYDSWTKSIEQKNKI